MGLNLKQEKFVAAYIGKANGNATAAARLAGYAGSTNTLNSVGFDLLRKPEIVEAVAAHKAAVKAEGIVNRQNRLDAYNRRWELLERVRAERAADPWLDDVPGGGTGLVVKQLKNVKHTYDPDPDDDGKAVATTIETWESAIDTGMLKELRELEKQTAQDAGQWTERQEHSGPDGGPIPITGIEVAFPPKDDQS